MAIRSGQQARGRALEVFAPLDGGVAEHVLRLAEGLGGHGWEVEVAAPVGSAFVPRIRALGVVVHELPFVRLPHPSDVAVARGLRALDRRGRFDVVHAHSSKAGALVRAALPRPRRLVYTPHCFAFSGDVGPGRTAYRLVERGLLRRTRALVAASEWERREGLEQLGPRADRIRVIYCGAHAGGAEPPHPEVRAFAGGRPVVGMISVLRPQKDPLTLVRAAALLRDAGRLDFRIVIVGNGELREAVLAEIGRLGLSDDVALIAFAGTSQPYLRAFDVFALPSRWESLPISVLEAMACDLPVVATDICGVPEAVRDGMTGRLIAPGSPEALADALQALMADPATRERMGRAGREAFEQTFRLETMLERVAGLYGEIAG
ncbi:MAG: glycosyl transferase group 1 [Solirubrobacteraceae bacterium]|nr:glycosyl transferase group 1 [Solirubrobacteraceae bacterium]